MRLFHHLYNNKYSQALYRHETSLIVFTMYDNSNWVNSSYSGKYNTFSSAAEALGQFLKNCLNIASLEQSCIYPEETSIPFLRNDSFIFFLFLTKIGQVEKMFFAFSTTKGT